MVTNEYTAPILNYLSVKVGICEEKIKTVFVEDIKEEINTYSSGELSEIDEIINMAKSELKTIHFHSGIRNPLPVLFYILLPAFLFQI